MTRRRPRNWTSLALAGLVLCQTEALRPSEGGSWLTSCASPATAAARLARWTVAGQQPCRRCGPLLSVGGGEADGESLAAVAGLTSVKASDFQIGRFLGSMGVVETAEFDGPGLGSGSEGTTRMSARTGENVRFFEAKAVDGRQVLMKEFLPSAQTLAVTEATMLQRLQTVWMAGLGAQVSGMNAGVLPFNDLLGFVPATDSFANEEFQKQWRLRFSVAPPSPQSQWLVFEWPGGFGNTLANWPNRQQAPAPSGGFFGSGDSPKARLIRRSRFVRAVMRQALLAVACAHQAGVVHRSLGAVSLALTTNDEREAQSVGVVLNDWGFATTLAQAVDDSTRARARGFGAVSPTELARFVTGEDLYALAFVFLELCLRSSEALAGDSIAPAPYDADQTSIRRLLEDECGGDLLQLRDLIYQEQSWDFASLVLDEGIGAGWELLGLMLTSRDINKADPATGLGLPFVPAFLEDHVRASPEEGATAQALLESPLFASVGG